MLGILSIIGIALWMTWLAKNIYPILFYLLQVAPKREALESPSQKKKSSSRLGRGWIGSEMSQRHSLLIHMSRDGGGLQEEA